jgi:hypothetical protein
MARKKIIDKIVEIEKPDETEHFEPVGELLIETQPEPLPNEVEIMPLKDFHIVQNEIDIVIKTGVLVTIPRRFLQNMVTEKVIEKFQK